MKTAIYIENGQFQVVLTPEDEWETNLLRSLGEKELKATVQSGSFYECRSGWIRESAGGQSLIVRFLA